MQNNGGQIRVKLCRVCGTKASGFNYGGLSCEKCKIFFLRNYNKLKDLTCFKKNNNCPIDHSTRRSCSRCRLVKCIQNGMTKPAAEVTKRKESEPQKSADTESNFDMSLQKILEPNDSDKDINSYSKSSSRKKRQKRPCLTAHEQQVVTELQTALSASFEDETKLELVGNVTEVKTAFNLTSLYARRIIKFCKSMPPFKILKEADQFTMLKSFYLKILMIRIAFIWDVEKQGYPVIEDESGRRALFMSSSLGQKMKCQDIVEYNIRQTNRMHAALESDLVIRDLLIAQALFTPIPTLSSLEFVRYHYTVFKRILFKYVQIKYRGNQRKTQQKFFALQGILKEFDTILRNSERLFKSEFPDLNEANEIMGELFNLM